MADDNDGLRALNATEVRELVAELASELQEWRETIGAARDESEHDYSQGVVNGLKVFLAKLREIAARPESGAADAV